MIIIEHRINAIAELKGVSPERGVEIDVRHDNRTGRLYLNHDPGEGDDLEEYLSQFADRAFVIFNPKEAGIEYRIIGLAQRYGISKEKYFFVDVEFPFLYRATRKEGIREIAVRYSEAEPIEMALAQKEFLNWVFIDTNTTLPLNADAVKKLEGFKTCLVSPDRWGRPQDIAPHLARISELGMRLDAIMVGREYAHLIKWAA